jgi:hypothetical protein
MRKSEGVQSRPVLRPGDTSPQRPENALDRPAKANALGVMLPVLAGGIFLALILWWALRHLAPPDRDLGFRSAMRAIGPGVMMR